MTLALSLFKMHDGVLTSNNNNSNGIDLTSNSKSIIMQQQQKDINKEEKHKILNSNSTLKGMFEKNSNFEISSQVKIFF